MPLRSRTERAGFVGLTTIASRVGLMPADVLTTAFDAQVPIFVPGIDKPVRYRGCSLEPADEDEIAEYMGILDGQYSPQDWTNYEAAVKRGVVEVPTEEHASNGCVLVEGDVHTLLEDGEVSPTTVILLGDPDREVEAIGLHVCWSDVAVRVEDEARLGSLLPRPHTEGARASSGSRPASGRADGYRDLHARAKAVGALLVASLGQKPTPSTVDSITAAVWATDGGRHFPKSTIRYCVLAMTRKPERGAEEALSGDLVWFALHAAAVRLQCTQGGKVVPTRLAQRVVDETIGLPKRFRVPAEKTLQTRLKAFLDEHANRQVPLAR
jgi:hypothetical protein